MGTDSSSFGADTGQTARRYVMSPFQFSRYMDFDGPNLFVPHACAVCVFERAGRAVGEGDMPRIFGTLAHGDSPLHLFPDLKGVFPKTPEELFGTILREMCRLGHRLPLAPPAILSRETSIVVAVEHFPGADVRPLAELTEEWLTALAEERSFSGEERFRDLSNWILGVLQCTPFSLSLFVEAKKHRIPFRQLPAEKAFLLGYGSRQLRLSGEWFSTDIMPDLAFLSRSENLASFVDACGFPSASKASLSQEPSLYITLAGGVCVAARAGNADVLPLVHGDNLLLAETLGSFFGSACLVLGCVTRDPGVSWKEEAFAVTEAIPGTGAVPPETAGAVLARLCPRDGVPGEGKAARRIPLVAGNRFSAAFRTLLFSELKEMTLGEPRYPSATVKHLGFAGSEGFFLDGRRLCHPKKAGDALRLLLRHPAVDLGLVEHRSEDIVDEGFVHEGADVVVLETPSTEEKMLERDILPGGYLVDILEDEILVYKGEEHVDTMIIRFPEEKDETLVEVLRPLLEERLVLYMPETFR